MNGENPRRRLLRLAAAALAATAMVLALPAQAGLYLSSAHGNSSYGVLRTSMPQYARGHCGHCHEQHASVDNVEPAPGLGPDGFLLFAPAADTQTNNVCLQCHRTTGGYQSGGVTSNYSYSYTFGGYTAAGSYDADIKSAFGHTAAGSSHYLPDIVSQALGKSMVTKDGVAWTLPARFSPCDGCHNPHVAQRAHPIDLAGGLLNTAISRPSDHGNPWGDGATERLNANVNYRSPFWYNRTNRYEPANDTTADGSNAPDYVKFCTDCHNPNNTIYSTNPRLPGGPRNLIQPVWAPSAGDKHGAKTGAAATLRPPYTGNHCLSCLDCHEPHGSTTNIYLLRSSVNGVAVSFPNTDPASYNSFCLTTCHSGTGLTPHRNKTDCKQCHTHGDKF
ncbi:MAG: hypothetical protein AB1916_02910 [Thermodesulfobacteriota bacterium]